MILGNKEDLVDDREVSFNNGKQVNYIKAFNFDLTQNS